MQNSTVVIGLGETGYPLFRELGNYYPDAYGYDLKREIGVRPDTTKFLNICLPYVGVADYIGLVKDYQYDFKPALTIIHSTTPIGVTSQIPDAVHSPILGRHDRMQSDLQTYVKWIGGARAREAADYFEGARMRTKTVPTSEETELMKLMCLAKYGMSIAFSVYQKKVCDEYGIDYDHVHEWDNNYNDGVMPSLRRPMIDPPIDGVIGGHCVLPGTSLLNFKHPDILLESVLRHG